MSPNELETPASLRRSSGLDLFRFCQAFARRHYGSSQGQALLPSGARIFYYSRLRLLRVGVLLIWISRIKSSAIGGDPR